MNSSMEIDNEDELSGSHASSVGIPIELKAKIRAKAEKLLETSNEYSAGNYTRLVESFIKKDLNVNVGNPNDALFTLNILEITSDSAIKKHEKLLQGSVTDELIHFLAADGLTMESWCPGGMGEYKKICNFVPYQFNYHAILTRTNGMAEVVPTQKKARVVRKLVPTEATRPKKITTPETDNLKHEANMKTALEVLLKLCKNGSWYPYFRLVINPKSFTQTCYNIFIVSFLINERYAKMCAKDSEIFIAPMKKNINDTNKRKNSMLKRKKKDAVVSINSNEWKELVRILGITKRQLPNMQPTVDEDFDESEIISLGISQNIQFVN